MKWKKNSFNVSESSETAIKYKPGTIECAMWYSLVAQIVQMFYDKLGNQIFQRETPATKATMAQTYRVITSVIEW